MNYFDAQARYFFKQAVVCLVGAGLMTNIAMADVKGDFEAGSGLSAGALQSGATLMIYTLMCVLGGWVMFRSVRRLIDSDSTDYYDIFAMVLRATILIALVILVLT